MWLKSEPIQDLKVLQNTVMKNLEITTAFSRVDEDLYYGGL
jgi:hypothetical protein